MKSTELICTLTKKLIHENEAFRKASQTFWLIEVLFFFFFYNRLDIMVIVETLENNIFSDARLGGGMV